MDIFKLASLIFAVMYVVGLGYLCLFRHKRIHLQLLLLLLVESMLAAFGITPLVGYIDILYNDSKWFGFTVDSLRIPALLGILIWLLF